MKKSRMLAATLCAVLMVGVLTVPAYAGGGDEGGEYVPWVGLEPVDPLPVEQPQESKPFTPEGTGTVLDNATDQDGKEFFTITTADEAVFYLVIDRQRGAENVYFLNAVTVGCLPLDCECYMLGKTWTGPLCRYFRAAVLPLDPLLEAALTAPGPVETRACPLCGRPALLDGRRRYCSEACARAALREQKRAYMRKQRGLVSGKLGPRKPACIKALPESFGGGAYHFTSCPCFPLILSTFQVLKGGYHGRKSRLCDSAIRPVR